MAALESLKAKIAKLQAQAEEIAKKESSAVVAKIRDIMDKHGLTTADIEAHIGGAKKRGRKPGAKLAAKPSVSTAKYRDPKTGATWTGHGRAPTWIASAKDRSKYLVEGGSFASTPATKKAAKAGNYVRGPQASKYRDPKSGATWSGRGPAPAWLAGTKDRTKFLIAGVGEGKKESKVAAPAKKAGAKKKAVAEKVATKTMTAKKGATTAQKVSPKKSAPKSEAANKVVAKKSATTKKAPAKKAATRTGSAVSAAPVTQETPAATSAG
ncbi:H-NS family nucleoid-associated regulatory protein [Paraburkholderia azotifigens]|uniref:H-NS histone family protein n=1 Tax=Paraburkholderia azotifigens TaxID=2057004 RepID=UPI00316F0C31